MSPDGPRPGSSGSTKEEDFRLMNGTAPQHTLTNGNCDIVFKILVHIMSGSGVMRISLVHILPITIHY